jgi:hypothetical protein
VTTPARTAELQPTAEQVAAIDQFRSGSHLVIEAGAGTGKTSTLLLLVQADKRRKGQYVAFNKDIVVETGQKLKRDGVDWRQANAKTAHSLAFKWRAKSSDGPAFIHRLNTGKRESSARSAARLGIEPLKVMVGDQPKYLTPAYQVGHVMTAIKVFCNSAEPEPTRRHIPYVEGIDLPDGAGRRTYTNNRLLADALADALGRAWTDLCNPNGNMRYEHDVYLKQWQLSQPRIPYCDFLLFDEAQDASPVMLDVVQHQAAYGTQLVYVGDSQQQIYEWRGAVNALASVAGCERTFLTQSFRFGPAIAEQANAILEQIEGAELRLKGHPPLQSYVGTVDMPRTVLCRTNAEAVTRVIQAQTNGRRPYLVGEGREVVKFARAVDQLRAEGYTEHVELACFDSWGAVQDYVEQDPQGSDLKLMVALVERFGTDTIIGALSNPVPEPLCDLVVSTAHKSKGREWPTVQLATDFPEPDEDDELSDGERRLLYVACTRAQIGLDIDGVEALAVKGPGMVDATVPDSPADFAAAGYIRAADDGDGYGYQRPGLG